uniref:Uncharacterized protein n=1 Tax=Anguilla anguilla TaxID=7936 RepID=A0A0E9RPV2_ANGAN
MSYNCRKRMSLTGSSVSVLCDLELQFTDKVNWKLCHHAL